MGASSGPGSERALAAPADELLRCRASCRELTDLRASASLAAKQVPPQRQEEQQQRELHHRCHEDELRRDRESVSYAKVRDHAASVLIEHLQPTAERAPIASRNSPGVVALRAAVTARYHVLCAVAGRSAGDKPFRLKQWVVHVSTLTVPSVSDLVESRCGAVIGGEGCLLPPLSSGGAQVPAP